MINRILIHLVDNYFKLWDTVASFIEPLSHDKLSGKLSDKLSDVFTGKLPSIDFLTRFTVL